MKTENLDTSLLIEKILSQRCSTLMYTIGPDHIVLRIYNDRTENRLIFNNFFNELIIIF